MTGILLTGTNSNVAYNTVSGDFETGITIQDIQTGQDQFSYSTANTIVENTITGGNKPNDIGIYLGFYTSGNSVIHNNISDVDTPILDNGTDNTIIP
jgi:hypothetical protein